VIDAHVHVWRLGRNDCTWPTADLAAICRSRNARAFYPRMRA
jgi:L-fuconolactonase